MGQQRCFGAETIRRWATALEDEICALLMISLTLELLMYRYCGNCKCWAITIERRVEPSRNFRTSVQLIPGIDKISC